MIYERIEAVRKKYPDSQALCGVNILLCVSGSIAAYKALELLSRLKKLDANIAVVMSEEAKKFISPLSFEALSHNQVLHSGTQSWVDSSPKYDNLASMYSNMPPVTNIPPYSINHIEYAKWANIVIIAPATANIITKLAYGIADNLITQTLLAFNSTKTPLSQMLIPAKILLAPAMNTKMFHSPQVQEALKKLQTYNYEIIPPREALLACNTYGVGALAEVEEIIFRTLKSVFAQESTVQDFANEDCKIDFENFWKDREVIITGGGASAKIDSVRAISNHSSGKQAFALAKVAYTLGAKVTLISSKIEGFLPSEIECVNVITNEDYANAIKSCLQKIDSIANQTKNNAKSSKKNKLTNGAINSTNNAHKKPVLFMAAALCDYKLESPKNYKIKKSTSPTLNIELVATSDILASINSDKIYKIGFKAESIDGDKTQENNIKVALQNAKKMLLSVKEGGKDCDCVCLNLINEGESSPFGADFNSFYLLDSMGLKDDKHIAFLAKESKLALSYKIFDFVKSSIANKHK